LSRRLRYSPRANEHLRAILRFIGRQSGSAEVGTRYVERLRSKCSDIARLPIELGRRRDDLRPNLRSIPFQSYVIFFRYEQDVVEIVAVLHGGRDQAAAFEREP
jgi:toxin ParE1/3/4